MIIFYAQNINDNTALITGEDMRHCSKVLRKRPGDTIILIDGEGWFYEATITGMERDYCQASINRKWKGYERPYKLEIAISPVKNPSRFEWFVEKAVEIGVDTIVPLICSRTEKRNVKMQRLKNIVISASKQSLKAKFALIKEPLEYGNYLSRVGSDGTFIAHLNENTGYFGKMIVPRADVTILIGPEGDFTPEEIKAALDKGIKPVSLGASRLRTETAGIVACQIVNTVNELYNEDANS